MHKQYRNPYVTLMFVFFTYNSLAKMLFKETTQHRKTSTNEERTCVWDCTIMDKQLQGCETRCMIDFLGQQDGQKRCQVVCAKHYVNCLETCTNMFNFPRSLTKWIPYHTHVIIIFIFYKSMIHSMILVCNTEKINRYIRIRIRISMDASRAAYNFMLINHLRMTLTMCSGAILNMHLLMFIACNSRYTQQQTQS